MVAIRRRYAGWAICMVSACAGGDLVLPSASDTSPALEIVSGNDQRARVGTPLSDPLVVRVVDGSERPISGATVQFRFIGTLPGATLDPEAATTDEDGYAMTTARLGSVIGSQLIAAWLTGTGGDVQATFRAVAVKKRGGGDDDD